MIVVFGSINLDLVARVTRLPRAGETLTGRSFATSPGGKGANQALAARRAGANVALHGAIGSDAFAGPALVLLRDAGVDLRGVRATGEATGVALIHVDDAGENAITVVAGANARADAGEVPDGDLGPATTLLLQLETPLDQTLALAIRARACGARVVLNAAPAAPLDAAWLDAIDVLIVNEHEAALLARVLRAPAEAKAFAAALAVRTAMSAIVTLGDRGAVAAAGSVVYTVPSLSVECADSVGAGDAFVGVFAAALDAGCTLARSLARACTAGALACTRAGAQPSLPYAGEIDARAVTLESRIDVHSMPTP